MFQKESFRKNIKIENFDEKLQYNINRKADKYEYLTGEEILP